MIKFTNEQARQILKEFAEYSLWVEASGKRERKMLNDWDFGTKEFEYTPAMVGLAIESILEIEG